MAARQISFDERTFMKNKKIKVEVGRWVRIWWEDSGAEDGICVENEKGDPNIRVAFPYRDNFTLRLVDRSQILAVGPRVSCPKF